MESTVLPRSELRAAAGAAGTPGARGASRGAPGADGGRGARAPGVEVRPLRQMTGEAEFNEVFLTDVLVADADRVGEVGSGWMVAMTTLMNERFAVDPGSSRGSGSIAHLIDAWESAPNRRDPGLHDELMRAWVNAEAARLLTERLRQQSEVGDRGPEGSAVKLIFASLNQLISGLTLDVLGPAGVVGADYTFRRPDSTQFESESPTYTYLRSRANSIEGGTSEVLRGVIAERILGLPKEPRPVSIPDGAL